MAENPRLWTLCEWHRPSGTPIGRGPCWSGSEIRGLEPLSPGVPPSVCFPVGSRGWGCKYLPPGSGQQASSCGRLSVIMGGGPVGPATGSDPGGAQCRISVCECVPWASVPSVYFQDTLPPTPQSAMWASGRGFAGSWVEGRPSVMCRLSPLVGQ